MSPPFQPRCSLDRHREVGEPDTAESVAELVAPDRVWVGRLKFNTSLQRWRLSSIEPQVEVAERSAVRVYNSRHSAFPHARASSAAAGHERDAVTRKKRCQRIPARLAPQLRWHVPATSRTGTCRRRGWRTGKATVPRSHC